MKKAPLLIILLFLFFGGCLLPEADQTALFKIAPETVLPETTTLLPVLDLRNYPEDYQKPDLNAGTTYFVPAAAIIADGKKVWGDEGFLQMIEPYQGPLPDRTRFQWEEFPIYDLGTDMGMGLEINHYTVKKTSYNALLPVHALLDASVMPLFALGALSTDGHTDLAGRVLPSSKAKTSLRVDLNLVSLRGGGRFLSKAYLINLTDPAITDSRLYPGLVRTRQDGQAFAESQNPQLIREVFSRMARDPELTLVAHMADLAWLDRVMVDTTLEPGVKLQALVRLTSNIQAPEMSAEELAKLSDPNLTLDEKMGDITAARHFKQPEYHLRKDQVLDPDWLEAAKGRFRLFNLAFQAVLKEVGYLKREATHRPLLVEEVQIKNKIMTLLTVWGQQYVPNQIYRRVIENKGADLYQRKALLEVLAEQPGYFENDEYVNALVKGLYQAVVDSKGQDRVNAAGLLVAARGENLNNRHLVPLRLLFKGLSGEDLWAGPLVQEELKPGRYHAEALRLAGAMGLEEAVPILLESLKAGERRIMAKAGEMIPQPVVDLLPTNAPAYEDRQPKAVLAAKVLGNYPGHPDVVKALRLVVDHFAPDDPQTLPAQAARSLGRLQDTEFADKLLNIWLEDWRLDQKAPVMRRAVLEALTEMAAYDKLMAALGQALQLAVIDRGPRAELDRKRTALLEIVECFENIRIKTAIPFMADVIKYFPENGQLRQAAFRTLARTPVPEAERLLRTLARSEKQPIASEAKKALNRFAMEKAKICYLKGYMAPEKMAVRLKDFCW